MDTKSLQAKLQSSGGSNPSEDRAIQNVEETGQDAGGGKFSGAPQNAQTGIKVRGEANSRSPEELLPAENTTLLSKLSSCMTRSLLLSILGIMV